MKADRDKETHREGTRRHTNRQADRQITIEIERQTDKRTGRQTDSTDKMDGWLNIGKTIKQKRKTAEQAKPQ